MKTLTQYVKRGGFFKAVVEDGSDIIFIVDYEGNILYCNRSVHETLGYRPKSLIGKNFFDYILPDTLTSFKKVYRDSTRKRFNESVEFQFRCHDKSYRYLEFNSINLQQKEKIKGLILDCRDVEQRKKDAEELLRAQKAKELFLANISHEIRTPINGIAGMASLLGRNPNAQEQATYLHAIQSAADNLKVIINDILDLASIESGKLKFEKIGFNLNDLLQSLVDTFSYQAVEKGLSLSYEVDPEANRIFLGDPVRLNQVLLNLISNSVKFTHQGSIVVRCSVQKKSGNQYFLAFDVEDTGIGIPKAKLNTIFESFSQADASVTRKYGGTGLGLTIVKQLVELQHGRISVKSKEGAGSVFSVIIPYEVTNQTHVPGAADSQLDLRKKSLQYLSILLVEDNDINRLYASSILKIWDCKIDTAGNGLVAVEKIKSGDYDVVLMDVQMPVMDGLEATKAIRSGSFNNQIPIIALTANATRKDIEECLAAGMNDCISKPFTPEDLFEKLNRLKAQRRSVESSHKTIDLTHLKAISNNNEAFIQDIVKAFAASLPATVEEIKLHCEQKNWFNLARTVHKIKPSLTLIGMKAAKESALQLEELAKHNVENPAISVLADKLCNELFRAMKELNGE